MRLNARNDVEARAWARHSPARVHMVIGGVRVTATVEEAVAFAGALLDAVEEARNG